MARRRQHEDPVPERLCRFVASEWPDPDLWACFRLWKAARHEWVAAHPDSVIGDPVDMLRAERATRLRMTCPG